MANLKEYIDQIGEDTDTFHEFVHGTSSGYTDTESGPLMTLPEAEEQIQEAISGYTNINPRGEWATATDYGIKDIVYEELDSSSASGPTFYICLYAHTSGTFGTDYSSGYWAIWQNAYGGIITVPTLAVLAITKAAYTGQVAYLKGRSSTNDGGQGVWVLTAGDFTTELVADTQNGVYLEYSGEDGSTRAWVRQTEGYVTVGMFGAIGDNVTDDTAALQAAFDMVTENGMVLSPPGKTYRTTSSVSTDKNLTLDFAGSTISPDFVGEAIVATGTLKSTVSITATYVAGNNYIVVDDPTGIEDGDLLNILSTDLYNTSRGYYFLGGNVLVSEIDGNTIYLSMVLPFDLTAANVTVNVYDPITVHINNVRMDRNGVPVDGSRSIAIKYGKNCTIDNYYSANFGVNLYLVRCYNTKINNIETGEAYTGSSESYGLSNYSCTNTSVRNGIFSGGRHGVSHGGQEPVFGAYFNNITAMSSYLTGLNGFDAHENAYDVTVVDSRLQGIVVSGNVTFLNCKISPSTQKIFLGVAEIKSRANYVFDTCTFLGTPLISLNGYHQLATTTRIHMGSLVIKDCIVPESVAVIPNLSDTYGSAITGDLGVIEVRNTPNVVFNSVEDDVELITIRDVRQPTATASTSLIQQTGSGYVKKVQIINSDIPRRYQTILLTDFGILDIKDSEILDVSTTNASILLNDTGGVVTVSNTDLSTLDRGFETTVGLSELTLLNSPVFFRTGSEALITTIKRITGILQAANPDTTGATLGQLETEVNELKAALRAAYIIAN